MPCSTSKGSVLFFGARLISATVSNLCVCPVLLQKFLIALDCVFSCAYACQLLYLACAISVLIIPFEHWTITSELTPCIA